MSDIERCLTNVRNFFQSKHANWTEPFVEQMDYLIQQNTRMIKLNQRGFSNLIVMNDEYTKICLDCTVQLMNLPDSQYFNEHVDPSILTDYYSIITRPVFFIDVITLLKERKYSHVQSWVIDIRQIWYNCVKYNHVNSACYNSGHIIITQFNQLLDTTVYLHHYQKCGLAPLPLKDVDEGINKKKSAPSSSKKVPTSQTVKLTNISGDWQSQMYQIYDIMNNRKNIEYFQYPVDIQMFPSYPSVIKNPMDFSTLKNKMKNYQSFAEFEHDMRLIFENSITFTPNPNVPIHKYAKTLLQYFENILKKIQKGKNDEESKKIRTQKIAVEYDLIEPTICQTLLDAFQNDPEFSSLFVSNFKLHNNFHQIQNKLHKNQYKTLSLFQKDITILIKTVISDEIWNHLSPHIDEKISLCRRYHLLKYFIDFISHYRQENGNITDVKESADFFLQNFHHYINNLNSYVSLTNVEFANEVMKIFTDKLQLLKSAVFNSSTESNLEHRDLIMSNMAHYLYYDFKMAIIERFYALTDVYTPQMNNQDLSFCQKIFNSFNQFPGIHVFDIPVDSIKHGFLNYYQEISNPIDRNMIKRKLHILYYKSRAEFQHDFNLISSNCIFYHQKYSTRPDSKVLLDLAQNLSRQFNLEYKGQILLSAFQHHPDIGIFLHPVDTHQYPNYPSIIQPNSPIDFSIINKKLRNHHYNSFDQLSQDIHHVWENCLKFNGYYHKITEIALNMLANVQESVKDEISLNSMIQILTLPVTEAITPTETMDHLNESSSSQEEVFEPPTKRPRIDSDNSCDQMIPSVTHIDSIIDRVEVSPSTSIPSSILASPDDKEVNENEMTEMPPLEQIQPISPVKDTTPLMTQDKQPIPSFQLQPASSPISSHSIFQNDQGHSLSNAVNISNLPSASTGPSKTSLSASDGSNEDHSLSIQKTSTISFSFYCPSIQLPSDIDPSSYNFSLLQDHIYYKCDSYIIPSFQGGKPIEILHSIFFRLSKTSDNFPFIVHNNLQPLSPLDIQQIISFWKKIVELDDFFHKDDYHQMTEYAFPSYNQHLIKILEKIFRQKFDVLSLPSHLRWYPQGCFCFPLVVSTKWTVSSLVSISLEGTQSLEVSLKGTRKPINISSTHNISI